MEKQLEQNKINKENKKHIDNFLDDLFGQSD